MFDIGNILNYIRGSKIVDFNVIIITDYRGFISDSNTKRYFKIKVSQYNNADTIKFNTTN